MIVESFYATKTFILVLDFKMECRIIDIRKIIAIDQILLEKVGNDIELFSSARLDETNEEINWRNGLRIPFSILYQESSDLEGLLNPKRKKSVKPLMVTQFNGELQIERENQILLEKIKALRYK